MSENQIVRKEPNAIVAALDGKKALWGPALGDDLATQTGAWARFRHGLLTALRGNPKLCDAPIADVLIAAGKAIAFGLDISGLTGEAFLVPINKRKKVGDKWVDQPSCELWRGVHGVIKLAYQSDKVKLIYGGVVYRGDDFEVDFGNVERPIRHTPRGKSQCRPEDIVAHYAIVALTTGAQLPAVIHASEGATLRERAKARLGAGFAKSPWGSSDETMVAMVQKCAVMAALKWAPKSVEKSQQPHAAVAGNIDLPAGMTYDDGADGVGYVEIDDDGEVIESPTAAPTQTTAPQLPQSAPVSAPVQQPQVAVKPEPVRQRPREAPPQAQAVVAKPATAVAAAPATTDEEF